MPSDCLRLAAPEQGLHLGDSSFWKQYYHDTWEESQSQLSLHKSCSFAAHVYPVFHVEVLVLSTLPSLFAEAAGFAALTILSSLLQAHSVSLFNRFITPKITSTRSFGCHSITTDPRTDFSCSLRKAFPHVCGIPAPVTSITSCLAGEGVAAAAEEHLHPEEVPRELVNHHFQHRGHSRGITQMHPRDQQNSWPNDTQMIVCMLHTTGLGSSSPVSDETALPPSPLKVAMKMNLSHKLPLARILRIRMVRIMKSTTKFDLHRHQLMARMVMIGPKSKRKLSWNHRDVGFTGLLQQNKSLSNAFADRN
jgi:hypothetical protein